MHQDEDEEAESEEESSEAESSDTSSSSSDEELIDRALPVRQTDQHVDVGLEVGQALITIKSVLSMPDIPASHRPAREAQRYLCRGAAKPTALVMPSLHAWRLHARILHHQ